MASARFQQLDVQSTPIGEVSLRRRLEPTLQVDVFEVKLGDEHLMSSLFTTAEIALAELGLAAVPGDRLDVLVGGLGLGYTAAAALANDAVGAVWVVEWLEAVISWHQRELVPNSTTLLHDDRVRLVHADFFDLVERRRPVADDAPVQFDAVLLDIDHTPHHVLAPAHAGFYQRAGLAEMAERIKPGGVFALWSDTRPRNEFLDAVDAVFARHEVHDVRFPNHHTGGEATNSVIVAVV